MPSGEKPASGRAEEHKMNNNDRTFERIESLFDIQLFADVNVLVAGCGSGGASVALQLAMSGIFADPRPDPIILSPLSKRQPKIGKFIT